MNRDKLSIDGSSNQINRCADCGKPITPHNDSGWEVFIDANTSQKCCWVCWQKRRDKPMLTKSD